MAITNGYATAEALKARLQDETALDDAVYDANIESASRLIDALCDRWFWLDEEDVTRTYEATSCDVLDVDDLVTLTSLKTDEDGDGTFETTWSASDYELARPDFPGIAPASVPYTRIEAIERSFPLAGRRRRRVQVVGTFGWPSVPTAVTEACLLQAARLFKRRSSPEGTIDVGSFGPIRVSGRVDPDALTLLQPYRRHGALVG